VEVVGVSSPFGPTVGAVFTTFVGTGGTPDGVTTMVSVVGVGSPFDPSVYVVINDVEKATFSVVELLLSVVIVEELLLLLAGCPNVATMVGVALLVNDVDTTCAATFDPAAGAKRTGLLCLFHTESHANDNRNDHQENPQRDQQPLPPSPQR